MKIPILHSIEKKIRIARRTYEYNLDKIDDGNHSFIEHKKLLVAEKNHQGHAPLFWDDNGKTIDKRYDGNINCHPISLFVCRDVTVVGRTEFVLKNNTAYHPSIINIETDVFRAELEKHATIDLNKKTINLLSEGKKIKVEKAISLLGQCNGNFAHWLTETLPRLVLVDKIKDYDEFPILIDSQLHFNLLAALQIVNIKKRKIIFVKDYQYVDVEQLIYVTPTSYAPPETRLFFTKKQLTPPKKDQFLFSSDALAMLRELVISNLKTYAYPSKKFIYLERRRENTGNGRCIINDNLVQKYLKTKEFDIFDISNLEIKDQFCCLWDSEVIIAPVGAALANLIFCAPSKYIILLSPYYPDANYFYFANFLSALGHYPVFVSGIPTDDVLSSKEVTQQEAYHRDYSISYAPLNNAVNYILEQVYKK